MGTDFSSIQIKPEFAKEIARELYNVKGEIIPLPGEIDFNFRIKSDAESYILKISRPDADPFYIDFQQELLKYVEQSGVQVLSPKCFPDIEGKFISEITDEYGNNRKIRMLSWIDGRLWSSVNPINDALLFNLGEQAAKLTQALQGFDHPQAHRRMDWDLAQADWTINHLALFNIEEQEIISKFQNNFKSVFKEYNALRKAVIHNDANDNNVVVSPDLTKPVVKSIIDYGDSVHSQIINDLAVALAYAVMHNPDPLSAAIPVIKGYHNAFQLLEAEIKHLYTLVAMRLIISVTKSAINKKNEPENKYLLISEKPAWELLKKWSQLDESFAHFTFRHTCGFNAHPSESSFINWSKKNPSNLSALFPTIKKEEIHLLDLSVSSNWIGHEEEFNDLDYFQFKINQLQKKHPVKVLAGGYLEPRPIYTSSAYDKQGNNGPESRSIHLGIDFWLPSGTAVHALYDGEIATAVIDEGDKEYGGLVILKHSYSELIFYTLHGHLSIDSIDNKKRGHKIKQGDCIGHLGKYPENGNWASHLHFQIILSTLGYINDFPGVAYPNQIDVWRSICPDPNLLFNNILLKTNPADNESDIIDYRKLHLGKSLSLSYNKPLKIVRGSGIYLLDNMGRKYMDTVNNVAHVGHENIRVVRAGQQQMAVLNTNTRYLHEKINEFAKELLSTFPPELSVVHFVNSGSEANELALRMAKAFTNRNDIIAVEIGYHGNTNSCIDISSYKFDGKGGKGAPEHTHIVPLPDSYRGIYLGKDTGSQYAAHVQKQIDAIHARGRKPAAFICESIISCGGQIELPEGYLELAYKSVRKAGGLCIADEVQVGCGRMGSKFWGFQLHDVVPDIVTIGKPIGNGHPLAVVVCTREVADAFANGMEYFNTFGGNPVSCAIGNEVLQVIRDEKLQENALKVGNYLKSGLKNMQKDFPVIGDVRGQGLFLGFELADENKNPLTEKASYLVNRMMEMGILMSTDGKDNNAIKIKPPMVFSKENADELLNKLEMVFAEDFMKS